MATDPVGAPAASEPGLRLPQWGIGDAILGWTVAIVASVICSSIILAVAGYSSGDEIPLSLIALSYPPLWLGFVGAPLVATIRKGNGPVRDLGARIQKIDVPIGVAVGLASQLVLVPLVSLPFLELLGKSVSELSEPAQDLADKANDPLGVFLLAVIVIIGAPIAEELFFRGLVMRSVERRWGTAWGIGVSAVFFGVTHFQFLQAPALIAFGLVLGYLVHRTGRLGTSIVAHMAFNSVTVVSLLASR